MIPSPARQSFNDYIAMLEAGREARLSVQPAAPNRLRPADLEARLEALEAQSRELDERLAWLVD
jgi:hypothetical protein